MSRYLCSYQPNEVWGAQKPSRFDFIYDQHEAQKFRHVGSNRKVPPEIEALEQKVLTAVANYHKRYKNVTLDPCEVTVELLRD